MSVNLLGASDVSQIQKGYTLSIDLTSQIFMENSAKGDPRGDIVARGIVSEELARVMYERYVKLNARERSIQCYNRT